MCKLISVLAVLVTKYLVMLEGLLRCGVTRKWEVLSDSLKDANGHAYKRTAYLEGRKKIVRDWLGYLDSPKAKNS